MNHKNCTLFLIISFLVFSVILINNSCTNDPLAEYLLKDTICYYPNIEVLIQGSCANTIGCHEKGSENTESFDATDYYSIMNSVKAGDPRHSALYKAITSINSENMMPPSSAMSKENRLLIEVWIAQGALPDSCNKTSKPPSDTVKNSINFDSLCFKQDVLPIFTSKCSKCHDGKTGNEDNYNLTTYEGIMSAGISPYDTNCKIYTIIQPAAEEKMPLPGQNPPLIPVSSEEIALLKKWIERGAFNCDYPQKTCDTVGTFTYNDQISKLIGSNCTNCHSPGNKVNLSTYKNVRHYTDSIVNGNPLFLTVIKNNIMPPTLKLDQCTVYKFEKWFKQGKLEF